MGCFLGVDGDTGFDRKTRPHGMRVGANGAGEVLAAYIVAAYALSDRPGAKRAAGWLRPTPRYARRVDGKLEFPKNGAVYAAEMFGRDSYTYYSLRGRPDLVRELVAVNVDNRAWIELDRTDNSRYTALVGGKVKPYADTDPDLELIARFVEEAVRGDDVGRLTADEVRRLTPILEDTTPNIVESCWYPIVREAVEIFRTARDAKKGVHIG